MCSGTLWHWGSNPQQLPTAKLALSSSTLGPCHLRSPCVLVLSSSCYFLHLLSLLSSQDRSCPRLAQAQSVLGLGLWDSSGLRAWSAVYPEAAATPSHSLRPSCSGGGEPLHPRPPVLYTHPNLGATRELPRPWTPPDPWRWVGPRFAPQAPKLGTRAQPSPLPPSMLGAPGPNPAEP